MEERVVAAASESQDAQKPVDEQKDAADGTLEALEGPGGER